MGIIVLFPLIAAWVVRFPLFETWIASLLSVVLLAQGLSAQTSWGFFIISTAISFLILGIGLRSRPKRIWNKKELISEITPALVFVVSIILIRFLCHLWPDFIAMGERLRDYAILSSIIQSPNTPLEPWMSGETLNYYVYWYRFGQFISSTFQLPVWETYHSLQSVTFAIYLASIFRIFQIIFSFRLLPSLLSTIAITFGSNVSGIWHALTQNDNWWGPSRVIKGVINEFPVWSFLLGDLHPHYLNVGVIPFGILCAYQLARIGSWIGLVGFVCIAMPAFLFGANAWEVPLWCITAGVIGVITLHSHSIKKIIATGKELLFEGDRLRNVGEGFLFGVIAVLSYIGAKHIVPLGDPFQLIRNPIDRTEVSELFLHWGIPISCYIFWGLINQKGILQKIIYAGFIALSLCLQEATALIVIILWLVTHSILAEANRDLKHIIIRGIEISAFTFLLIGELVFMNDAYGGENERMNTIFKIYTVLWFFLHASAFERLRESVSNITKNSVITDSLSAIAAGVMIAFAIFTGSIRYIPETTIQPRNQGLTLVEREFNGAGVAIQTLERSPRGVVLEAQGNPYSYTSHVATLSGNTSYLGWANHVGLLLKKHQEIEARSQFTRSIYEDSDTCDAKKQRMQEKGIQYLVVGPLERKAYASLQDNFACLALLVESGGYKIYKVN